MAGQKHVRAGFEMGHNLTVAALTVAGPTRYCIPPADCGAKIAHSSAR